jgi:signal transduction histidine kinase/DNA-binding NarL/FixJ family response regulator
LLPSGLILKGVSAKFGHVYWPDAGSLTWLYLTYFFGYLFASGWALVAGWRRHIGGRASGQIFILVTCFSAFIGGATNFPLWYDVPIQPYGNVLGAVYVFLWGHGLCNNRVPGLSLNFYKACAGLLLSCSAALFYLLIITFFWNASGAVIPTESIWMHGLGAFLISILIFWGVPPLKLWTERVLEGVFRTELTSGLSELEDLPAKLSDLEDNQSIFEMTAETLLSSLDISNLALFAMDTSECHYRSRVSFGKFPNPPEGCVIREENPIIKSLSHHPRCLVLDEIREDMDPSSYQALVSLRNELKVSLIAPIFSNHEMYGLIVLGPLKQGQNWSEEAVSILFSVGAQIGINFRTRELEAMVKQRSIELEQRNLELVKANNVKQDFLASISHEIRNPLNGILGITRLLVEDKGLTQTQSELIAHLVSCKSHLDQLITPVLNYSSLEAGVFKHTSEPFDVNVAVNSVVAMYEDQAREKGLQLKVDLSEIHNLWIGAITPLKQILINLVSNGIKYTPRGSVSIKLSYQEQNERIAAAFIVEDTGSGIPLEQQEYVFRQFTRLTEHEESQIPGTGLGLAIARKMAEVMQGALRLESNVETGACFVLELPFQLGEALDVNAVELRQNQTHQILRNKKVLVADDMDFNRFINRVMLEKMGAVVEEAMNGEVALLKLRSEIFDLAILDINMPGLSGIEVVREYCSVPTVNSPQFIALSAHATSKMTNQCLSEGFDHFIEKPLEPEKLGAWFGSEVNESSVSATSLLDYLGNNDPDEIASIERRFRKSFYQELERLMQVVQISDQKAKHDCVHKLRGLASLRKNKVVQGLLDEISTLIAANASSNEYFQLFDQLKVHVNE